MGYIYKATNTINNKVYIGQTRCSIDERWKEHIFCSFFKKSSGYNQYLHKAIRKYGADAFLVEQVEECDNALLDEREIYWIAQYDSTNKGYNLTLGGGGRAVYSDEELLEAWRSGLTLIDISKALGINKSQASRRLRSLGVSDEDIESRRYKACVEKNRKTKVYQYDLDGNFVAEHECINKFSTIEGYKGVRDALNGTLKTAGGYQWRLYKVDKIEPYKREIPTKCVYQYSMAGEYIRQYESGNEAADALGVKVGCIYGVCGGRGDSYRGYRWSYQKFDKLPPLPKDKRCKPVAKLDPNGAVIEIYETVEEAAKANGVAPSSLRGAANGNQHTSAGYVWKYISA
jgi:group I intron endonuclease